MKRTKWATHTFSVDEKKARRKHRRADELRCRIRDGLSFTDWTLTRQELHERLDRTLDTINQLDAAAKDIFPEVAESFTVSSMRMKL